jgi:peptidase M1-like protein
MSILSALHTPRGALIAVALVLALPGQAVRWEGPGTAAGQEQSSTSEAPQPAAVASPTGADYVKDRDAIFEAFYTTGLDTANAYSVANLSIKKDNMTLLLKQGTLFLMKPIAGEVTGAAFLGEGEASMTPPNRTERYMLKKYYGAEVLKEPFSEAIFRFSDGTDKALLAAATRDPAAASQATRAEAIFRERNGWLNGTRDIERPEFSLHLEMQFLENRISGFKGHDFFVADLNLPKHKWVTFRHNPRETHENMLTTSETMGAKNRRYYVPWSQWHKLSDYDEGGHYVKVPQRDGPRILRVLHNDLTLNMPTTKTSEWEARLRVESLVDGLRCFRFDLVNNAYPDSRWDDTSFYPVRVLSVVDEQGKTLEYTHKKDQLLVVLPQPIRAESPITLAFKGRADVIYQLTAESYGLLQSSWYPQNGYWGGRSSYHWTARVPRPFLITGSGKILREFQDKDSNLNGIETRCDLPVHFPWVIFGRFQKAVSEFGGEESKRAVPVTIHSFPTMTVSITDKDTLDFLGLNAPITFDLNAPSDKVNNFFAEGKEIFKVYEKVYGPYPYDELHIAQMAPQLGFGQAPQGFVQLWGIAFLSQAQATEFIGPRGTLDFIHGFYAHEIAHQWWAHQVGPASGDDEWLSESFAEYASGIFVKEYQGAKRFQGTLEGWRKYAKESDREAPIAAANTLGGPEARRHRTHLLYDKGPYVLHMLRVQLDDEKYMKVMRSVQETYRNQDITTEMLVREVNKVAGADYTYFFDQWFWDVGIPTFRYTWKSERQPDGKFLISVHVSQDDKDHVKRVLMPVYIHFKDKTIPQYKPVTQASQEIKILSPMEPKDVTLDDERTLLAEIVKAR